MQFSWIALIRNDTNKAVDNMTLSTQLLFLSLLICLCVGYRFLITVKYDAFGEDDGYDGSLFFDNYFDHKDGNAIGSNVILRNSVPIKMIKNTDSVKKLITKDVGKTEGNGDVKLTFNVNTTITAATQNSTQAVNVENTFGNANLNEHTANSDDVDLADSFLAAAKVRNSYEENYKRCPNKMYMPRTEGGIVKIVVDNEEINMSMGTLKLYGLQKEIRMKFGGIICLSDLQAETFLAEFKKQFHFGEKVDELVYHDAVFANGKGQIESSVVTTVTDNPYRTKIIATIDFDSTLKEILKQYLIYHVIAAVVIIAIVTRIVKRRFLKRKLKKMASTKGV